jgi:hypothetical protein
MPSLAAQQAARLLVAPAAPEEDSLRVNILSEGGPTELLRACYFDRPTAIISAPPIRGQSRHP